MPSYETVQAALAEPPKVKIERIGRWSYRLTLFHTLTRQDEAVVLGRERARRKAGRMLARYERERQRAAEWAAESEYIR